MKVVNKAILPQGFQANAVASGLKKSGKLDLALFYSEYPAVAACLFTSNKVQAAPLKLDKELLKKGKAFRAILVNSGNANCFTGKAGMKDAQVTAYSAARELGLGKESVLVNSTGVIGKRLEIKKIKAALPALASGLSGKGIDKAKKAIMTTDTFAKEVSARVKIGSKTVAICGVAKGAGMISPDMATMLAFILTDARISQAALKKALSACARDSFNCITVDGCMSTNDSLMALANGRAQNAPVSLGKDFDAFVRALREVCLRLAKMIVRDGEGATKFITITVSGARSPEEARAAALKVANSDLFKTAMYGENPNFGRIASAIGASGIRVREEDIKMRISSLKNKEISVKVSVGRGSSGATVYTSDLTPEYVKINAEYN